jgi:hypothetical protein
MILSQPQRQQRRQRRENRRLPQMIEYRLIEN